MPTTAEHKLTNTNPTPTIPQRHIDCLLEVTNIGNGGHGTHEAALKEARPSASTAAVGSIFHCGIVLTKKECLNALTEGLSWRNLYLRPLVLV